MMLRNIWVIMCYPPIPLRNLATPRETSIRRVVVLERHCLRGRASHATDVRVTDVCSLRQLNPGLWNQRRVFAWVGLVTATAREGHQGQFKLMVSFTVCASTVPGVWGKRKRGGAGWLTIRPR